MQKFNSIEEILDFAIGEEQQAQAFYQRMADKMTNQAIRKMFVELVDQEKGHEARLKGIKKNPAHLPELRKVTDLKIADYSVDVTEDEIAGAAEPNVQKAYLLAMKKEKAAFRMYTDLAAAAEGPEFKHVLQALAQEEARHKLTLEIEYEDHYLAEN
ncbi:MAG: ferritin family protein [Phycisphaerae bacterium]|nr:ferritin family protein [Phycisphaerae bacterium]